MKPSLEKQIETLNRGVAEIIPRKEFSLKLEASLRDKNPLRVKLGIDPTAPDIHLGHSVVLRKLRQFQERGHKVILIIGDFTARIGDPSGRSEIRKVLTDQEIKKNTETYVSQIGKILDTKNPSSFELRFNSEWLSPLSFQKIIEIAHHFTVAQMLERDDFKKRYEGKQPIGVHEFFYPLMQGYDSVAVQADVELGGTDQTFNILVGREMQKIFGATSLQAAMLLPILEGTDGVQKMSKSLGNTIGVTDSPEEMFGKIMSIPDPLIPRYFELLTDAPIREVEQKKKLAEESGENPRDWKADLGEEIVRQYHGEDLGKKARENFDRIFREKLSPLGERDDFFIPAGLVKDGWMSPADLAQLFSTAKVTESVRDAKRLILQGGVEIDGKKMQGDEKEISVRSGMMMKVGKKRFFRLQVGGKAPSA